MLSKLIYYLAKHNKTLVGECQWKNCEETVIDDEVAEVCGSNWGQLNNSMDVTMGDRMNVNNEMIELG